MKTMIEDYNEKRIAWRDKVENNPSAAMEEKKVFADKTTPKKTAGRKATPK